MEGRPTRRVYNEIIMRVAIFLNLEESRSHGSERKARQARGQGACPPPLGARPTTWANQAPSPRSCSTASKPEALATEALEPKHHRGSFELAEGTKKILLDPNGSDDNVPTISADLDLK